MKIVFKKIIKKLNTRNYKLFYKNFKYYNLRIYNRFTLNKIIIV